MSPSSHTIINRDVDCGDRSRVTSNADSESHTVVAHISLQESTLSVAHAPNDVDGPASNTIPHHCYRVTQAGLTHCIHAHPTGHISPTVIPCGMNTLHRVLPPSIVFDIPSLSESTSTSNGNLEAEYQKRRLITSKSTIEETRFVFDFNNSLDEKKCHTGDRTSTNPSTSSISSPTWSESGDRNQIPGYYQFFDNSHGYQDLITILALNVMHIVRDPLVWSYTRDFARRVRSLSPDEQAIHLLDFMDTRSDMPGFRDNLFTVLEARSDLKGFLKKRT